MEICYNLFVGPYKSCGQHFTALNLLLKEGEFHKNKLVGVYFDDPSRVEQDKLRYLVGYVV
eukprot:Awhi_evm1s888